MKDLITTIAAVTILMVFVVQFSANQVLTSRILSADKAVDGYRALLVSSGQTEERDRQELASKLGTLLGCHAGEVKITENEGHFEVRAPLKNIVACADFLGITPEENQAEYAVRGEAV